MATDDILEIGRILLEEEYRKDEYVQYLRELDREIRKQEEKLQNEDDRRRRLQGRENELRAKLRALQERMELDLLYIDELLGDGQAADQLRGFLGKAAEIDRSKKEVMSDLDRFMGLLKLLEPKVLEAERLDEAAAAIATEPGTSSRAGLEAEKSALSDEKERCAEEVSQRKREQAELRAKLSELDSRLAKEQFKLSDLEADSVSYQEKLCSETQTRVTSRNELHVALDQQSRAHEEFAMQTEEAAARLVLSQQRLLALQREKKQLLAALESVRLELELEKCKKEQMSRSCQELKAQIGQALSATDAQYETILKNEQVAALLAAEIEAIQGKSAAARTEAQRLALPIGELFSAVLEKINKRSQVLRELTKLTTFLQSSGLGHLEAEELGCLIEQSLMNKEELCARVELQSAFLVDQGVASAELRAKYSRALEVLKSKGKIVALLRSEVQNLRASLRSSAKAECKDLGDRIAFLSKKLTELTAMNSQLEERVENLRTLCETKESQLLLERARYKEWVTQKRAEVFQREVAQRLEAKREAYVQLKTRELEASKARLRSAERDLQAAQEFFEKELQTAERRLAEDIGEAEAKLQQLRASKAEQRKSIERSSDSAFGKLAARRRPLAVLNPNTADPARAAKQSKTS